jgi:hypothetical protein
MTSPIVNPDGHIWMRHAEHGGYAQLPDTPYWRANGWEPADGPPPEPDLTKDPHLRDQPEKTTESPEEPSGLFAATTEGDVTRG